ncbi:hypothetical protein ACH4U3_44630 [Streptomyces griseoruber]|uniref:hypothetical protein n=1 Tax=Streptomyces griseoruber TaxID=1943 RepID=UPI0037A5EE66
MARCVAPRHTRRRNWHKIKDAGLIDRISGGVPSSDILDSPPDFVGHVGFSPVVPLRGDEVANVVQQIKEKVVERTGVNLSAQVFVTNDRSAIAVAAMFFNRHDAGHLRATIDTAKELRTSALVAVPRRSDAVPARGENPLRIDGILDRLCDVPVGVVTEGELVLREVREVEVRSVLGATLLPELHELHELHELGALTPLGVMSRSGRSPRQASGWRIHHGKASLWTPGSRVRSTEWTRIIPAQPCPSPKKFIE